LTATATQQPIAGVSPPGTSEVNVMTVYPTLAATGPGRFMGRLCSIQFGFGFFTLGKLFALLLIPVAIPLFALSLLPGIVTRYRLTNRRVVVQKGPMPFVNVHWSDERSVDFGRFDTIDIEVLPGQAWFPAGDLIFRRGNIETFRLAGVSRPETFRRTCLAASRGFLGAAESE